MVALLRPQPEIALAPRQLRLVADGGHLVGEPSAASHRSDDAAAPGFDVSMVAVVVAALVIFGGLALLRASQGGPEAGTWAEVGTVSSSVGTASGASGAVVAGPGDRVVVASPGDSLWSIAESIAPESDPRPVVAALIEANGSDSLQIGQQIVIPEQLLD